MEHIFNYPVITVQSKCALEHDCGTPHQPAFQCIIPLTPEIYIKGRESPPAMRAGFPDGTPDIHVVTSVTRCYMVYYLPASRGLFYPPNEMHEHGLACATPSNNSQDLPFGNLKRNILEDPRAIEIHAEVFYRYQWSLH